MRRCSRLTDLSASASTPCLPRFSIYPRSAVPRSGSQTKGRYAEIARAEMVVSGDYVTPRDDFELYFEKPPLVYWAEAGAIKIFGGDEFAVRLPAAIFSIGQVVITAALAEAMLGASAGFLAALALALSPLFFALARFATLDPALAFFLTAALSAFYAASQYESFAAVSARRWLITSAAMLALGTLCQRPCRPASWRRNRFHLARIGATSRRDPPNAARVVRDCLHSDRRAVVRLDGGAKSRLPAILLHPRASAALREFERAWMGSVVFHSDNCRRDLAVDFFRAARMVRDARRRRPL